MGGDVWEREGGEIMLLLIRNLMGFVVSYLVDLDYLYVG